MPPSENLQPLIPIAMTVSGLLAAGVAALIHVHAQSDPSAPTWKTGLTGLGRATPWRGKDVLVLLLWIAGALAIRSLLRASTILDVLSFQGVLLLVLGWQARHKLRPWGAPLPFRSAARQALLRWLAILPILWLVSFTWQILLTALDRAPDFQMAIHLFIETDDPWARAQFIVFAVIVAPIAEEALFRGILLPLLVRRLGAVLGLGLVAIGFAALHGDVGSFPGLAVLSVALSLAYVRTGTLLVPMAMHALFNAANLALVAALVRSGALPT